MLSVQAPLRPPWLVMHTTLTTRLITHVTTQPFPRLCSKGASP